jgi:glycosyltransferase involved in cell wall biosynthesis
VGSLPETVTDGVSGLLVPPGDAGALAEALIRYFCEGLGPQLRAGVERETERFSWDRLVAVIEAASQPRAASPSPCGLAGSD